MRINVSVDIDRPIDEVFQHTTGDVTKWSKTCVREEVLEERPGMVGTTFLIVTQDRGREMEFTGTVTEHEPPTRSRVLLVGKPFDLDVLYTFEAVGGGTRVTQESEVRGKGVAKVMMALMGWMMKKSSCDAGAEELGGLKRYCESQPRG